MSVTNPTRDASPVAALEARPAHGVWSPVLTPLTEDSSIDAERFVEHAGWLLEQGCHGLAVFGTTGEATSFSVGERTALLDAAIDAGLPADRLMVGTGCCAVTDAITLSRHALARGCKRLLMLPPFYYKGMSDDGLADSYVRIIEGVGDADMRLFFYHFPRLSGVPITLGLIERVVARCPEVVAGVKDSSGDWESTRAFLAHFGHLAIFPGSESLLLRGLRAGGAGCITASANFSAAAARGVFDAWCAGEPDVDERDERMREIRTTLEAFPMVPALKHLTAHYRNHPGWRRVRPPMQSLPDDTGADLRTRLERLGFRPEYG